MNINAFLDESIKKVKAARQKYETADIDLDKITEELFEDVNTYSTASMTKDGIEIELGDTSASELNDPIINSINKVIDPDLAVFAFKIVFTSTKINIIKRK